MEGTEFDRFEMTEIDLTEEAGSMEEVGQIKEADSMVEVGQIEEADLVELDQIAIAHFLLFHTLQELA